MLNGKLYFYNTFERRLKSVFLCLGSGLILTILYTPLDSSLRLSVAQSKKPSLIDERRPLGDCSDGGYEARYADFFSSISGGVGI